MLKLLSSVFIVLWLFSLPSYAQEESIEEEVSEEEVITEEIAEPTLEESEPQTTEEVISEEITEPPPEEPTSPVAEPEPTTPSEPSVKQPAPVVEEPTTPVSEPSPVTEEPVTEPMLPVEEPKPVEEELEPSNEPTKPLVCSYVATYDQETGLLSLPAVDLYAYSKKHPLMTVSMDMWLKKRGWFALPAFYLDFSSIKVVEEDDDCGSPARYKVGLGILKIPQLEILADAELPDYAVTLHTSIIFGHGQKFWILHSKELD